MNRCARRIISSMMALSALLAAQTECYCSKCVKIEEEREKEKTAHPQIWEYYDETNQNEKDKQKPALKIT